MILVQVNLMAWFSRNLRSVTQSKFPTMDLDRLPGTIIRDQQTVASLGKSEDFEGGKRDNDGDPVAGGRGNGNGRCEFSAPTGHSSTPGPPSATPDNTLSLSGG